MRCRITARNAAIDLELRSFMLRVFDTMAGGLGLTGIVAYAAASSGLYAAIAAWDTQG